MTNGGGTAAADGAAGAGDGRGLADDRGSALAFAALAFLGILGMLALAIDLGMLYEARGQAQRTADAAALAGASALVDFGNDAGVEDEVYRRAAEYVERNPVSGELASVEPGDVDVDREEWRVTVTAYRTVERGNPVATLFGGIVGFDEVDVSAVATAEAAEAGGVKCLLPLAIPDRWFDADDDGLFEPEDDDYYEPWPGDDTPPPPTGYSNKDIGAEILIKPFQGDGSQMNESWYYPWRPEGQQGADDYRENILDCMDEDRIYEFGEEVDTEPGNMAGPTRQGFQDLIDQDEDAYWDTGDECVKNDESDGECTMDSPRIRPAPMFDPREAPDPGSQPFTFRNFANVFVERIEGKGNVYVRFLGLSGVEPGESSDDDAGPAVRVVRLIQ